MRKSSAKNPDRYTVWLVLVAIGLIFLVTLAKKLEKLANDEVKRKS
jgi:hypothetical protein